MRRNGQALLLNLPYLEKRFVELELKKWWIAEQVGIDKKTIQRWFNGSIKRVKIDNLVKLSEVLECDISDIILDDDDQRFSTVSDTKKTLELIEAEKIFSLMHHNGKWAFFDQMLSTLIRPDSSEYTHAYFNLYRGACAKFLDKDIEAIEYSQKALEYALKTNNPGLMYGANINLASVNSKQGNFNLAQKQFAECLKVSNPKTQPQKVAVVLINEAQAHLRAGQYVAGLKSLENATLFLNAHAKINNEKFENSFYKGIYILKGQLYFYLKEWESSRELFSKVLTNTSSNSSLIHSFTAKSYLALLHEKNGESEKAEQLASETDALAEMLDKGNHIFYIINKALLESAKGNLFKAKSLLDKSQAKIKTQSVTNLALLYQAYGDMFSEHGETAKELTYRKKVEKIYKELGLE